ncbi:MAG: hypothetical protein ACI89L_001419 [Phycisphaerales bacterium]|jgi:hypothetical protein
MSFYTDFNYYFPGPAPLVTGKDLAEVVGAFIDTGVLRPNGIIGAELVLEDQNYPRVSPSLEDMLAPDYRPRRLPNPNPGYKVINAETIRASRSHRRLLRRLARPFQPSPPP